MDSFSPEGLDKIRQQFDSAPYPKVPIETPLLRDANELFVHSFVTPTYLRDRHVISTAGKLILDVGCGTGVSSLFLAIANPEAKIIGLDLSPTSIELAHHRLQYHGYADAEFFAMPVEEIESLNLEFDFIHCDEVLYLLPDFPAAISCLAKVLKPGGVLRGNLHSRYQRHARYRAQELFKVMGLMDENPDDVEVDIALQTIGGLRSTTQMRQELWNDVQDTSLVKETVLTNWLLQGDKGFTVPDMFAALEGADLDFISMTNWRQWNLLSLFEDPNDLPSYWAMSWDNLSIAQQLEVFELMHPVHRLLDFWCGKTEFSGEIYVPLSEWSDEQWMRSEISLHPSLRISDFREVLSQSIADRTSFKMNGLLNLGLDPELNLYLDAAWADVLWLMIDRPCSVQDLLKRYIEVATKDNLSVDEAFDDLKQLLTRLELDLYVLLEADI